MAFRRRRRRRSRFCGRATTCGSSRSRRGSATGRSKIRLASDGAKFFLILLKVITIFSPLKIFVPISAAAFLLGVVYGVWNVIQNSRIPNGAVLLLMFAVMVFLVGLVSEQISTLRFRESASRLTPR